MNTDPLSAAKAAIKAQLSADLSLALSKLRKAKPELSLMQAWAQLEVEESVLVAACRAAEDDEWPEPPKPPVYRYVDTGKRAFKVAARRPREDGKLMRVEA